MGRPTEGLDLAMMKESFGAVASSCRKLAVYLMSG